MASLLAPYPTTRRDAPPAGLASTSGVGARAPSMVEPRLELGLVATRSGFDALEAEWNDLFQRVGQGRQLFQQFNWLWHWANHYLGDRIDSREAQLQIVTVRRDGRLVLVWPLVLASVGLVRQLSWMGEPASQYGDVLMDARSDSDARDMLEASWRFLVERVRPDAVHLRKVRTDAAVAPLLAELNALTTNRAEAPYLALGSAPTFAAYEERYSAKARKNRRRLMRRLGERATVAVETWRAGPEARDLARLAVSMKRAWLKDRGQLSPALADPRAQNFFCDVACGRTRPTGAVISVLRSAGEPASIQVGFEAKGTLALHVIVYSLKFEKTAAGVLHLESSIARAHDDGVTTLDLLAPHADYKMDWADGTIGVADHTVPLTAIGRLYAHGYLAFARTRGKALAERLTAHWRSLRT